MTEAFSSAKSSIFITLVTYVDHKVLLMQKKRCFQEVFDGHIFI